MGESPLPQERSSQHCRKSLLTQQIRQKKYFEYLGPNRPKVFMPGFRPIYKEMHANVKRTAENFASGIFNMSLFNLDTCYDSGGRKY